MKAAVHRRFGGPEVISVEEVPDLRPRRDQVLIRVHASTVSMADHRARSLDIPRGLRLPSRFTLGFTRPRRPVLGMDAAGVVEAVGESVTRFRPGDRVFAMLGAAFGGHAELVAISQDDAVAHAPRTLPLEDTVALVFGGITARAFLRQARVGMFSRVLINGATGAVGSAAVQLAAEAGATVTAVCSGGGAALARSLGAARVIDRDVADFAAREDRYDVIVDCVGNASFERVAHLIEPGGALALVVADAGQLLRARGQARRSGIAMVTAPGPYRAEDLDFLAALAEGERLRPVRDRTFDLKDVAEAHRLVDTGRKRGAVVLRMPVDVAAQQGRHRPGE